MIGHPAFEIDPWRILERHLDLDVLPQAESVFALGNGHLGLRGNLDEGEPTGVPGTYLAGFHERRPLPYAEAGYGYPEDGQTVVNVTDGKLVRLMVGDELFDVRYGALHRHERVLDLRTGVLRREVEWESPTGTRVRIVSERLVSLVLRGVAAIRYAVEPLDGGTRLSIQSELVANQPAPDQSADPRAAAMLRAPLESEVAMQLETGVLLAHRTRQSGLRMAACAWHLIDGPENTTSDTTVHPDVGRVAIAADVASGERLSVTKLLAYGWSGHRSSDSVRAQVMGAMSEARHAGWDGLAADQKAYLADFWERSDVEIEGDPELQQAIRFAMFHVLQAGARGEGRAIAAKGLTGPGYDGHAFWDTESFVLPLLTYTVPRAARDALRWRKETLPLARERAEQLGLNGAAFPWRTIDGRECSAYWPAGTAAFHVDADVADAVRRYCSVTEDHEFLDEAGLEILVETARMFTSLGYHDSRGRFRIDGVTGPDEYSAIADNNVYTNLMAARNLRCAAAAAEGHTERAAELDVGEEEIAAWRRAADHMVIPYDEGLGVHSQSEGFTAHERWDFAGTPPDRYPLLLHFPYFELYRRQVVKQADLTLALYLCGDHFTPEEKARDFAYYEALTVRDSSLSACAQAVVAAETGHLELAYAYTVEAALMDLGDLEHNTADGLHIASLAGAWIAVVAGLGGLRDHGSRLSFAPRLPAALTALSFRLTWRGTLLRVTVGEGTARYEIGDGRLRLDHHGQEVELSPGEPLELPIPGIDPGEPPHQPPGREPAGRSVKD